MEKAFLDKRLKKSRKGFFGNVTRALAGQSRMDETVLDDLEEVL